MTDIYENSIAMTNGVLCQDDDGRLCLIVSDATQYDLSALWDNFIGHYVQIKITSDELGVIPRKSRGIDAP